MTQFRIGIDLGGTKAEVILLSGDSEEHFRTRLPTPKGDYDGTLDVLVDLVAQAEKAAGLKDIPVGVGIPGTVSRRTGKVKNANAVWLNGQPMQKDLSKRLKREVKITNDANCLALSEATDGAGKDYETVFAIIIGTGCGAGISFQRQPLVGPNGVAGEWGHNPLPWTSEHELRRRPCHCGRMGCNETFLSGTGLARSFELATGESLKSHEITQRAEAGQVVAQRVLDEYMNQLARGLSNVVNVLDPDVIVVGGGVSNIDAIYTAVPKLLPDYVFGGECDTPVVKALHGDSSGVRGAAWLNPID